MDPFHRQRQHNGEIKGGAWKTRRFRPWQIVCVLTGFANEIAALKFEWIWQHPYKSKLTRDVLNQQIKGRKGVGSKETIKRKLLELHTILAEFFDDSKGLSLHFFSEEIYHGIDKSLFPKLPACIDLHIGKTKCFDDLVLSLSSLSLSDATTQMPVMLNEIKTDAKMSSSTEMDVEEQADDESPSNESSENEEHEVDSNSSTTSSRSSSCSTVESLRNDTSILEDESVINLISPEKDVVVGNLVVDLTSEDSSTLHEGDDDDILNFNFRLPTIAHKVKKKQIT